MILFVHCLIQMRHFDAKCKCVLEWVKCLLLLFLLLFSITIVSFDGSELLSVELMIMWLVIVVLPMTSANRFDSIFSQWFAHESRSPAILCVLKFCDRQRCMRVSSFYCKLCDSRVPMRLSNTKSNINGNFDSFCFLISAVISRSLTTNSSHSVHKTIAYVSATASYALS